MDLNLVVLAGTITTEPEVRSLSSGMTLIRYLVTVRTTEPSRRVDVVPVTLWEPGPEHLATAAVAAGRRVWVAGSIQRRFWSSSDGRSSRIELVANDVRVVDDETSPACGEEPASV